MAEYTKSALRDMARQEALRAGVDPDLFIRLVNQESRFNPNAVSGAGARGLGQVMPGTAQQPGYGVRPFASEDLMDPQENLRFSADYLGAMLREFEGDVPRALAAYNAGAGAVQKHGGVPPFKETQDYVKIIAGDYEGSGFAGDAPADQRTEAAKRRQYAMGDTDPGGPAEIMQAYQEGLITEDEFRSFLADEEDKGPSMGALMSAAEMVQGQEQPTNPAPTARSLSMRLSPGRTSATPGAQAIGRLGLESLLANNPLLGIR